MVRIPRMPNLNNDVKRRIEEVIFYLTAPPMSDYLKQCEYFELEERVKELYNYIYKGGSYERYYKKHLEEVYSIIKYNKIKPPDRREIIISMYYYGAKISHIIQTIKLSDSVYDRQYIEKCIIDFIKQPIMTPSLDKNEELLWDSIRVFNSLFGKFYSSIYDKVIMSKKINLEENWAVARKRRGKWD